MPVRCYSLPALRDGQRSAMLKERWFPDGPARAQRSYRSWPPPARGSVLILLRPDIAVE